jgi:hypothetical protein
VARRKVRGCISVVCLGFDSSKFEEVGRAREGGLGSRRGLGDSEGYIYIYISFYSPNLKFSRFLRYGSSSHKMTYRFPSIPRSIDRTYRSASPQIQKGSSDREVLL